MIDDFKNVEIYFGSSKFGNTQIQRDSKIKEMKEPRIS